jgi:hypothetical protein
VWLDGIHELKKFNDFIGIRTRDIPAFGIAPQPSTLQRRTWLYIFVNGWMDHRGDPSLNKHLKIRFAAPLPRKSLRQAKVFL